jgi:hypothetical protein
MVRATSSSSAAAAAAANLLHMSTTFTAWPQHQAWPDSTEGKIVACGGVPVLQTVCPTQCSAQHARHCLSVPLGVLWPCFKQQGNAAAWRSLLSLSLEDPSSMVLTVTVKHKTPLINKTGEHISTDSCQC